MKPRNREGDGFAKNQISLSLLFLFFSFLFSLLSQERERRGTHSVVARTVYRTVDSSVHSYPYCYNFQTNKFL